jgi:hypothetical protein
MPTWPLIPFFIFIVGRALYLVHTRRAAQLIATHIHTHSPDCRH